MKAFGWSLFIECVRHDAKKCLAKESGRLRCAEENDRANEAFPDRTLPRLPALWASPAANPREGLPCAAGRKSKFLEKIFAMPSLTCLALLLFIASIAGNLGVALSRADWAMLPAALAGWYLADMGSGIVHMIMDYRPCRPDSGLKELFFYSGSRDSEEYKAMRRRTMKKVGLIEQLIFDFKIHHPNPLALGRRSLMYQIGSTIWVFGLPVSLALNAACLLRPTPGWMIAGACAYLIGGAFSQYFHGTLHREHNPWFIHAMRRLRLLMTPTAHELHHKTLQRDFATINGWANPPLNFVFRALRQRGMMRDSGLEPT